jgi:hypothetical protein
MMKRMTTIDRVDKAMDKVKAMAKDKWRKKEKPFSWSIGPGGASGVITSISLTVRIAILPIHNSNNYNNNK